MAVEAWAQHAVHCRKVARWTRTFAASARLNWANVAGVLKPVYPGATVKGKADPPACRSASASSSSALTASSAASKDTNGAGGAVMGWSTSIGIPKTPLRSGVLGMPIDVDHPITAPPAPFVSFEAAEEAVSALLDEALADLQAGGSAFPFTVAPGYTGFSTPATFAQFNRALAAKVLVHRATFLQCTACWAQASTAMDQSFVTTAGLPGSLATGVYYAYSTAAGEPTNPVSENITSTRYWVHPSILTGVQLRANGDPDLRLSSKVTLAPAPRTLNDLTGTYKPTMYNSATDRTAADLGADIPWIKNEELLLLRAEIRWNTGDKAGAIDDINLVRENAGGLEPTSLTTTSPDDDFITEVLYNRLYSLMWEQGTRWIDARRYNRLETLPLDRSAGD